MSLFKKITLSICWFVSITMAFAFLPKTESGTVSLQFENYIGNVVLHLDSPEYKNDLGQAYNVTKFKYYISNIHLIRSDGKEFILDDYFLVNEEKKESKQINLSGVEEGDYSSLSFTLGVDSLHNCSGVQSGALDPINGMFWAWNTGYVFLKLEGRASESKSPGRMYEYHIGGFKNPYNCIRNINLKFENTFRVEKGKNISIRIKADASEVLKSPTTIDFSKLSSVTDFNNATMVADNYMDMFSIIER
jgi:hypothetical protein